ncbi:hypothetical protein M9H77_13782 [Catharanthus roseus]|uniref:Uncharacterized protein n=1 Tax=Catharanthus roseus TaxID=4058 RepID=A0ACC0BLC9_CATRO|nr:hypothetical protein M9H77_13782 [Catharanthus roseus]
MCMYVYANVYSEVLGQSPADGEISGELQGHFWVQLERKDEIKHCNRSRPPFSRSSRDRGTPPGRSSRSGWRGRSRPSSGRGTTRQQQQLTQRGRSADAWANIATTDQRRGTPFVVGIETFSRAKSSINNIPNLSSEQW